MHLTPAVLLALASVNTASVIHNELRSDSAANASVTAYNAILEASPAVLARGQQGKVFLTKDNSCGKTGAGKNHGWYCDAKMPKGGACCSSDGWCGNGPKYCEAGCQKDFGHCDKGVDKPPKPVFKCGPKNKNKKCNNDECCSANGFCGTNKNFCGVGCQGKFGQCGLKPKPAPKPVEDRCGPANKNKKCPEDQCCSHEGYCGIGVEYCAVPQNCLRGFGKCDSDMMPPGPSTLKDPRPHFGKIPYGKYIMDCKKPGTVAMTFDDGPTVYTNELLDKLEVAGAKATFMVSGINNGRGELDKGNTWPKLLKRMIAEGHQIVSHTWSHPHMNSIKSEDRKMDMAKNERAIANVIGKYPTYMRPPYGECDAKSGCLKDMKEMGYSLVAQSIDSGDWKNADGHIQESEELIKTYFKTLGPHSHALICQHDTLADSVQELTPIILQEIKSKGFRAVTLGECLGDDMKNWYRVPGKGTQAAEAAEADVVVSEPEPEDVESEHTDKVHGEEKRYLGFISGRHPDAPPLKSHPTAESEKSKRSNMYWGPNPGPAPTHTPGHIETDHQMEVDELKVARISPIFPTFPDASDVPIVHARDEEDKTSNAELPAHLVDEIARTILTPDEIAADKAAKMTPEDVADHESAKEKCVFNRGKFCGKIPHFVTKWGCFQSAKECYHQMKECITDADGKRLDDHDKGKDGCRKWSQICNEEVMYCAECVQKNLFICKSKFFKPSKPEDMD